MSGAIPNSSNKHAIDATMLNINKSELFKALHQNYTDNYFKKNMYRFLEKNLRIKIN